MKSKFVVSTAIFLTLVACGIAPLSLQAQTEAILHSFAGPSIGGSGADGAGPAYAGMVMDSAGNLYGTTYEGGAYGLGAVFELVKSSSGYTEKVLYSFAGAPTDGTFPQSTLLLDSSGNLYGTTYLGGTSTACGSSGCGTVFELAKSAGGYTERLLLSFAALDGAFPEAGLIMDSSGNLYGTALWGGGVCGGQGCGTVFELANTSGSYSEVTLYRFTGTGSDGANPFTKLVMDSSGNLYGTTQFGGSSGDGTVFELVKSPAAYTEKVLYSFPGPSGGGGANELLLDSSGNLFGTTENGGSGTSAACAGTFGCGTAFELVNSAGSYAERTLYNFGSEPGDGFNPVAGLVVDTVGNLYGTTVGGGASTGCGGSGCGAVFELLNSSGSYTEKVLHSFSGANGDGAQPEGPVIIDSSGGVYGTTTAGGDSSCSVGASLSGCGIAYEVAPAPAVTLSATGLTFTSQADGTTSAPQTITVTNTGNANLAFGTGAVTISGTNTSDFAISSNTCDGTTVAPSSTCSVMVTFTPSIDGSESATLNFADNASNSPQAVSLSGTGLASAVSLSAASLTFTSQTVGTTSASQTVTLTNSGSASLSITSVSISMNFSETNNCGSSVSAGSNCTISVSFAPTAAGSLTGKLSISDDAANSPQIVSLSGTSVGAPAATLSASSLGFGTENEGTTSSAKTVTVTNGGTANLTFAAGAVTISGTNAADFAVASDGCSGETVAPGATCAVSVTFTASVASSESAIMNFADNASNSPQTVSLTGAGVAPDFTLGAASGASSSATVSPGQTANYSLTVAPAGGFKQPITFTCAGAPVHAGCSVSPSSVTLDGLDAQTVSVGVTTAAASLTAPPDPTIPPAKHWGKLWVLTAFLLMILSLIWVRQAGRSDLRVQSGTRIRRAVLVAVLLGAATLAACGGGTVTTNTQTNLGTPAGSYTLTVTGKSGNLSHSTTLTLNVQ